VWVREGHINANETDKRIANTRHGGDAMIEKHYTIAELAEVLNISLERTRQLVMDEPGVLKFSPEHEGGRPTRRTMYRIPDSVVQRILRRSANPAA
jgi:hypothetical protein